MSGTAAKVDAMLREMRGVCADFASTATSLKVAARHAPGSELAATVPTILGLMQELGTTFEDAARQGQRVRDAGKRADRAWLASTRKKAEDDAERSFEAFDMLAERFSHDAMLITQLVGSLPKVTE